MSLAHALDHLWLDGWVSEVLAVEILRFFRHRMAHIPNHWNVNILRLNFSGFLSAHSCLVARAQILKLFSISCISHIQTRSQRVHVEEGILSVLNISYRVTVKWLMTSIAHSGQVHPCSLLFYLNTLEPKTVTFSIKRLTQHHGTLQHPTSPWAQQGLCFIWGVCTVPYRIRLEQSFWNDPVPLDRW